MECSLGGWACPLDVCWTFVRMVLRCLEERSLNCWAYPLDVVMVPWCVCMDCVCAYIYYRWEEKWFLMHPIFVVSLVLAGALVLMKGDGCSERAARRLFCLLKAALPWC